MTENKKPTLVFAPGCFDSFEGSQEELDALIKEIQEGFDKGDFFENAKPVDLDELDDETLEAIGRQLGEIDNDSSNRNLH